ncbi:GNAT family N-acetyltransferase [Pukyongia salina]|uniref:GNAT family N-acetyltransferase n=1 Tax=Pukyongia salina TaxID=2094025 RepID=A0A2S0HY86_9FLAO|nr:GNAT family N-acetyltransferase [Pukyongia salina]AVI51570.1 GNAT family N-acetyltransferase [Pukyongia salina]
MDLETNRLRMHQISEDHISEIYKMNCMSEVARFNTTGIPDSPEVTATLLQKVIYDKFLNKRTLFGWAIYLKDTKRFIGELGMQLSAPKYNRAEIHYSLVPQFWGNGYATETVKAALTFGFNTLHLHRIEAGVAVDNIASVKVLEKAGMQREGRKRKILPLAEGWTDNFGYAILKEDGLY